MNSNTTTSKKAIPAISVISDPLSREVLFLSVLKWFFFLLSCKIIYYLLDCRNAMKLFYLKGRQLMYAVINSPLPFYINMKLLKKWTLEIKKTHFWILVQ